MRAFRQGQRGFTLIELIIVVAILGILAGIVVLSVSGVTDRGKTAACNAEKNILITAEETNFGKNGTYTGMSGLVTNGFISSATTNYWTVSAPAGAATASSYTLAKVDSTCP